MSHPDTRVTTPPDVHAMLVALLLSDASLMSCVGERIYAGDYPDDVILPAIEFQFPEGFATAPPAMAAWTFDGQFNVHADSESEAGDLRDLLLTALVGLQGSSHEGEYLVSISPWGVQSTTDARWVPPKPRKTIVVTLTARK